PEKTTTEPSGPSSTAEPDQTTTVQNVPSTTQESEMTTSVAFWPSTEMPSSTENPIYSTSSESSLSSSVEWTTEGEKSSTVLTEGTTQSFPPSSDGTTTLIPSTQFTTDVSLSTVACNGREVIKGDVYLLFDYTRYQGTMDETKGIEDFITNTLFSFEGTDFYIGTDDKTGEIPLHLFLVTYPGNQTQYASTPIKNLDVLNVTIDAINKIDPTSDDSNMKDALQTIYNKVQGKTSVSSPSIVLISKSDEFVQESVELANKLRTESGFTILGVPLNGISLTPLTLRDDLPLDLSSTDSQVDTATQIDSILMSLSHTCISPAAVTSTSTRSSTASTTKIPTTVPSCVGDLSQKSIAFVYQRNSGVADPNGLVITALLGLPNFHESNTTYG
ncbi:hypothetical protein PFISCL1PPCAC_6208, partial [Pristionchus fissidentatus]